MGIWFDAMSSFNALYTPATQRTPTPSTKLKDSCESEPEFPPISLVEMVRTWRKLQSSLPEKYLCTEVLIWTSIVMASLKRFFYTFVGLYFYFFRCPLVEEIRMQQNNISSVKADQNSPLSLFRAYLWSLGIFRLESFHLQIFSKVACYSFRIHSLFQKSSMTGINLKSLKRSLCSNYDSLSLELVTQTHKVCVCKLACRTPHRRSLPLRRSTDLVWAHNGINGRIMRDDSDNSFRPWLSTTQITPVTLVLFIRTNTYVIIQKCWAQ